MIVTLEEVKTYLRVDYPDEDDLINGMISTAEELVAHVTRMTLGDLPIAVDGNIKTAILYAVAYLYEHREDADHHHLMMNLRYLLFGVREPAF